MKVLITGANGMLGTSLQKALLNARYDIYPTDINTDPNLKMLDVCDYSQVEAITSEANPDIIFHLAAETDVDKCESEIEHAYKTNAMGTENMVLVAQELDVPLIYISTAGVFDGKKETPFTEFDQPNPLNIYAKSKFEGEKIVQGLLKKYFIFRAGWMIGGGAKDKKFVGKIVNLLKTRKKLSVVNDKFGSPTFTEDMSRCMVEFINTKRYGTYHMANKGMCSRFDMACKIVEVLKLNDVEVLPVGSDVFPLPAPRGRSEAIQNFKLDNLGMNNMPTWQEALECYVKSIATNRQRVYRK